MEQELGGVGALATKPISPEAPAGSWVRYQPEFEVLKQQIDRITAVRSPEVDWEQVISTASAILECKSKDLLVASYLAAGLQARRGVAGLGEGLASINEMCRTYWDSLYPEARRMRARVSALEWLAERLTGEVQKMAPRPADAEGIAKALQSLEQLEVFLSEQLGGDAPSLAELRHGLEDLRERASAPARPETSPQGRPAAGAAASPSGGPSMAPAPEPAAPADLSTPEGVDKATDRVLADLGKLAGAIRKVRPEDPSAYQLARIAAWLPLDELPPNKEGTTRVPPLGAGPQQAERWQEIAAGRQWPDLLEQAEHQFTKSIFWLDAQRFVCQALEALGEDYRGALDVVKQECRSLLRRVPGLQDLRFSNGTPFADEDTRSWLRQEVLAASGGVGAGETLASSAAPAAADDPELEAVLREASSSSRRQVPEAVRRLGELLAVARNRRQGFLRRLALARFLMASKEPRVAVAHLERLEEESRRFGLEEWEPALEVDVLGLLLACHRQLLSGPWKNVPGAAERAERVFLKLARLDPGAAMEPAAGSPGGTPNERLQGRR